MSAYVHRPVDFSKIPENVKMDVNDAQQIVFFGNDNHTLWLLDRDNLEMFIANDKDAAYFADNGEDITVSVYAKGLVDMIAEFGLEAEVLTVNPKRNLIQNADPEMVTNLQAAANYCLQYYHFTSDAALMRNMLKR